MEVTLREGTAADYDFVRDLGRRTLSSSVSAVRPASPEALGTNYDRLCTFIYGASHVVVIAESSLEKLGFLVLLDEMPDEVSGARQAFIAYMAVEPHARHQGIAGMLLARAEQIARERGLPAIALMVTEGNQEARALYARAGFLTERRLLVRSLND